MNLRDYQINAVDAVWERLHSHNTALCIASTGAGKSEIFIEIIKRAIEIKPSLKFVILVQKISLARQTAKRLKKVVNSVTVYSSSIGRNLDGSVIVATIQSIYNQKIDGLSCIIVDEVHNADFKSGRYADFLALNPSKMIGFTATPFNSRGKIYGEGKKFEQIDFKIGLAELITKGHLVKPTMKRVEHQLDISKLRIRVGEFRQEDVEKLVSDKNKIREQIEDALTRMEGRKQVVWACASIQHCEDVNEMLKEFKEKSVCLHSKMSKEQRELAHFDFEQEHARHLVFVSIVSEGYDHPPIDCVVLMRPMRSPVLYVQTVGRGLRPSEGKENCLVLDYGKVIETIGPLDDPTIREAGTRIPKTESLKMKFCKKCLEYLPMTAAFCPVCNYQFISKPKDVTKNTSYKPNENASLLSDPKRIIEENIKNVILKKYTSKNGNACLMIEYIPDYFLSKNIREFFVWDNPYSYRRAQKRLIELDVELAQPLDAQVTQVPRKIPKTIWYTFDGKYPQIQRLNFI